MKQCLSFSLSRMPTEATDFVFSVPKRRFHEPHLQLNTARYYLYGLGSHKHVERTVVVRLAWELLVGFSVNC